MSVDVEIEERVNAVEVDVDVLSLPVCRHGEGAAVGTHFVAVLIGHPIFWRRTHHAAFPVAHSHTVLEDDTLVGIERFAILKRAVFLNANHVPVHRHLHLVPSRGVEIHLEEILGTLLWVLGPMETPLAVERLPKRTVFGQHLAGFFHIVEREEPGVRLLLVVGYRVGALPLPSCGSRHVAVEIAAQWRNTGPNGQGECPQKKHQAFFAHR